MNEGEIRQAAKMYALVAEMEAIKTFILLMTWENEERKVQGEAPAYSWVDLTYSQQDLEKIARRLREEI